MLEWKKSGENSGKHLVLQCIMAVMAGGEMPFGVDVFRQASLRRLWSKSDCDSPTSMVWNKFVEINISIF